MRSRQGQVAIDNQLTRYWGTLLSFNLYRIIIALALLGIFIYHWHFLHEIAILSKQYNVVSIILSILYAAIVLLGLGACCIKRPVFSLQTFAVALTDILIFSVLIYFNPRLALSLGILINVSIAAASVLSSGRLSLVLAVIATVIILLQHILVDIAHGLSALSYAQIAILAITFFATALLGNSLSRRIKKAEAIALQRGQDIMRLERLNEYIIQHMQVGVMVVNAADEIRLLNNAAQEILRLNEQLQGMQLNVVSQDLAQALQNWKKTSNMPEAPIKLINNGSEFTVQFSRLGSEDYRGTIIFLEDMHLLAQKSHQAKLIALGRVTASIAHEIRNPLSAVMQAAELLPKQDSNNLPERIIANCRRMNHIINNILQMSRPGKSIVKEIEIRQWLQKILDEYQQQHNYRVNYQANSDAWVKLNPSQIQQVINNLLDNARKHSQSEQIVDMSTYEEEGFVCIDICDDGIGIADEIKSQIFEPFFSTDKQSVGLGLYVAKELCQANNIQIDYRSQPRSCFTMKIAKVVK